MVRSHIPRGAWIAAHSGFPAGFLARFLPCRIGASARLPSRRMVARLTPCWSAIEVAVSPEVSLCDFGEWVPRFRLRRLGAKPKVPRYRL